MLSGKKLQNMTFVFKALRNERVHRTAKYVSSSKSVSRQQLKLLTNASESTLSGYLSLLKSADIICIERKGRNVTVQATQFGKQLLSRFEDSDFAEIAADACRMQILEILSKNGGETFTGIYYELSRIFGEKKQSETTTPLLSYHLKLLKDRKAVTVSDSLYHILPRGKMILKNAMYLFS